MIIKYFNGELVLPFKFCNTFIELKTPHLKVIYYVPIITNLLKILTQIKVNINDKY